VSKPTVRPVGMSSFARRQRASDSSFDESAVGYGVSREHKGALLSGSATSVYRLFDQAGRLLYVGITSRDPGRRLYEHERQQPWWPRVHRAALERFPARPEALRAEQLAIKTEGPEFNERGALA
jgi:predicted GIY-YIG superfamily endonuclease